MQETQQDLARVRSLIEKAALRAGNEYRLAKAIGYPDSTVANWKAGQRPCPVSAQALLAEAAGLNPNEVLAYAVIEREPNPKRKERLANALGKALGRMSAAASCVIFASVLWASKPAYAAPVISYDV